VNPAGNRFTPHPQLPASLDDHLRPEWDGDRLAAITCGSSCR
jgi:hypothetical protein